jgi:hypothetical protein
LILVKIMRFWLSISSEPVARLSVHWNAIYLPFVTKSVILSS